MNWADIIILAVVSLSVVISVVRGFVKEVLSLAAWVAAFWVAAAFAAPAGALLDPYIEVQTVRLVVAFVVVMFATLIVAGCINYAICRVIASTGLSGTDRLLGALFGLARGAAIVVIAVLVGGLTTLPEEPWWRESRAIGPFQVAAQGVVRWMPPDLARNFSF